MEEDRDERRKKVIRCNWMLNNPHNTECYQDAEEGSGGIGKKEERMKE